MNKSIVNALAATLLVTLLSSCQLWSAKQESWFNPEFKNYKMGKTTVLAISESESRCRQFEAIFVDALLPYVSAGSLHASQDLTGKIDKENLDALLKENDVKTIVITSIFDGTQRQQVVGTGYTATPYNSGYWGYYNYGYALTANTATVSSFMEYVLETNVYDVESEQLVWSGRKSIFDDRSDMENMKLIVKNVIRDLEKRGILN